MTKEEYKKYDEDFNKLYSIWTALNERPNIVDVIWDSMPYKIVEFGLSATSKRIKLEDRNDNYSVIIADICDSCLEKNKVSMKQFKCVVEYSANYNNNNLKYKYKFGKTK